MEIESVCEDKYIIKIFDDIQDKYLSYYWKELQHHTNCFPQMYYEWCEPWWRYYGEKRELHIVTVINQQNDKILAIAPLCIEKKFGIRILRSIPIRFGDFYSFIIEDSIPKDIYITKINEYIKTFDDWHIVQLTNVNNKSKLYKYSNGSIFKNKKISTIHAADVSNKSFGDYLGGLSKNERYQYRRRLKKTNQTGKLNLECINSSDIFIELLPKLKELYDARWSDDYEYPPDGKYYLLLKEIIASLTEKGKIILFLLKLDNEIIAYDWGISHNCIFYIWNGTYNVKYKEYHPGILNIAKVIEELTRMNYEQVNFCAGDYGWKKRWATQEAESANYELYAHSSTILSRVYVIYRLKCRDHLMSIYFKATNYSLFRTLSRMLLKRK